MKNAEIRALSSEALAEKIVASEKQLHSLQLAHARTPIENPMQLRALRRTVARMKTELHSRTLASLTQKVNAKELTEENARQFLLENRLSIHTPVGLSTIKKVIGNAVK